MPDRRAILATAAIAAVGVVAGVGASLPARTAARAEHGPGARCALIAGAALGARPDDRGGPTLAAGTAVEIRARSDGWRSIVYADGVHARHGWLGQGDLDCSQALPALPVRAPARGSQIPSDQHVLLQGFHWTANTVERDGRPAWYRIISENAQRIADSGFTLVWFPPPSDSYAPQGYMPRRLYDLHSRYGTEAELRTAIDDLGRRGVGAIADVVANHRAGTSDWADFTHPTWPTTESVARNDEWGGPKSNRDDTGDGERSSRDLDWHSVTVQDGLKDWMRWLRNDVGFVGWRYDLVKGFAGWGVEALNRATNPVFTVGEFLDGNTDKVVAWIDGSHPEPPYRSAAFDFPFYYALYDAVMSRQFDRLRPGARSAGVIGAWSEKAVTLVKSHDFEEVRNGEYGPAIPADGRLVQGYAVTLTHPGTPSVFWRDIYDSAHEDILRTLIRIRRCYRISSGSKLFVAKAARDDVYAAYITGSKGELAVKIGPGAWSPDGGKWWPANTKLLASGGDFAVWGDNGQCPARPE